MSATVTLEILEPVLAGTPAAHGLIRRIAGHVHANRIIELDFTRVESISAEFAEAAFGPLVAAFGRDKLLGCLHVTGAADWMIRTLAEAICRSAADARARLPPDARCSA